MLAYNNGSQVHCRRHGYKASRTCEERLKRTEDAGCAERCTSKTSIRALCSLAKARAAAQKSSPSSREAAARRAAVDADRDLREAQQEASMAAEGAATAELARQARGCYVCPCNMNQHTHKVRCDRKGT